MESTNKWANAVAKTFGEYTRANGRGMEWVSVDERLPENGQMVLACYVGVYNWRLVVYYNNHFGAPGEPDSKGSQPATHWMELPEPPQ